VFRQEAEIQDAILRTRRNTVCRIWCITLLSNDASFFA